MADKAALLAEAYKRGLLPPEKKAAYEEAVRRGIVPSPQPAERSLVQKLDSFGATLNRGIGIGDEMAAGFNTARGVVDAAVHGQPISGDRIAVRFKNEMAAQRQLENDLSAAHPRVAALTRGTGMATTLLVPTGAAMQGGRMINMARGAVTGGTSAAVYAAADAGSPEERLKAAADASHNPVALALGAGAGALAPAAARATPPKAAAGRAALAGEIAAFDKAHVDPSLAAVKGNGASRVANAIAENPVAGVRVRRNLARATGQAQEEAGRIGETYGAAASHGATGEAVQSGVQAFNDRFSTRAGKLYDKAFLPIETAEAQAVERAAKAHEARVASAERDAATESGRSGQKVSPVEVPGQTPVVVPVQTMGTLRNIISRINAPRLSSIITDSRVRTIASALESDGHQVRFTDLRALRSWVRRAQGDEVLRQGMNSADLQRIESALTSDIYANAERLAGPRGLQALKRADSFYKIGVQRIRGSLQAFVGKGDAGKPGEAAYDLLVRAAGDRGGADTARLGALKKSLRPHEWGDVAATVISRLGKPTAGAAEKGDFSVGSFVTNYAKLSPEGRALLFGTGEQRAALDNLAAVTGKLKAVEKGANASNTAVSTQSLVTVGGLMNPVTTLPTIKLLGGLAGIGEAMSNPGFVRWLAKAPPASAGEAAMAAHIRGLKAVAARDPAVDAVYRQAAAKLSSAAGAQAGAAAPPQRQAPYAPNALSVSPQR